MHNIYIIGGAGYVGLFLVHQFHKEYPNSIITVVTKNTTKEVFFRLPNVRVMKDISKINGEDIILINLAYSLGDFYKDTKLKNDAILYEIESLILNNNVKKIIHVSSIVLSQNEDKIDVSKVLKNDIYYFAKSYFEYKLSLLVSKAQISTVILRSGNIVGPGSPWISKIIERLFNGQPLVGENINYPSRTTFIGSLIFAIIKLCNVDLESKLTVMNFCEFGDLSWKKWIDTINLDFNYPVRSWSADSIADLKPRFKEDFKNIKSNITSQLVLLLIKGRYTNNFVIKIIDTLNLDKLKNRTKNRIKNQAHNKARYIDLSEYNTAKVFLNLHNHKLENVPEEISRSLPFDFEKAWISISDWITDSGYKSLKR